MLAMGALNLCALWKQHQWYSYLIKIKRNENLRIHMQDVYFMLIREEYWEFENARSLSFVREL